MQLIALILTLIVTIYHVPRGVPEFVGDSLRAIKRAARAGYDELDLNMLVTKDGVIVITHWPRPLAHGFRDPLGRIRKDALVSELTWNQCRRLFAIHRGRIYRIAKLETALDSCRRNGIEPRLEPKSDAFYLDWPWAQIRAYSVKIKLTVRMYAIRNLHPGFGRRCVAAAKRHNIPGRVIH